MPKRAGRSSAAAAATARTVSLEDAVAQIQSLKLLQLSLTREAGELKDQNMELSKRLEQAEQEAVRQRGAIEQSAQVVEALSLVVSEVMPQTLQEKRKPSKGKLAITEVSAEAKSDCKPTPFNNNEKDFVKWSRETVNYMNSVREGLNTVLSSAVDVEKVLDWNEENIELEEMNEQVYYLLIDLTEGESLDMVMSVEEGQGPVSYTHLTLPTKRIV